MIDTYQHPFLDLARQLHRLAADKAPPGDLAKVDQANAAAIESFADEFGVDLNDPDTHQAVLAGMVAAMAFIAHLVDSGAPGWKVAGVFASQVVMVADHIPAGVRP